MAKTVVFERGVHERDPHAFLHSSCKPIDRVKFAPEEDVMFGRCESGMCFT